VAALPAGFEVLMSLPATVPVPAVFPAAFPDAVRATPRSAAEVRAELERALAERIPGALTPRPHVADPPLASGVAEFDALCGGAPRGAITEICGAASSGRTSLLLAMLAAATRRGEFCCLVDAGDCFHPESAANAGIELKQLLWVRCGRGGTSIGKPRRKASLFPERSPLGPWLWRVEQALQIADLVLQGGGFTLVAIDLAGVPAAAARRVPLASWFRFRRAVEDTASALVLMGAEPVTQSCAGLVVRMQLSAVEIQHSAFSTQHSAREDSFPAKSMPAHAQLLESFGVRAHVLRNSAERGALQRKGPRTASAEWRANSAVGT
jgi:recombination protein RecA